MIKENLSSIVSELPSGVKLVAVSKFHPFESIEEAYAAGQRVFAESRPQELQKKVETLDSIKDKYPDLVWHFIGHLQTNKLKMVLPYVDLVQSVDSEHLLTEIDKWGRTNNKVINVLLELHVAEEETKQGFFEEEILDLLFRVAGAAADGKPSPFPNVRICGLMGMATNTSDEEIVRADFARISDFMAYLTDLFPELTDFKELSIGMSQDWRVAIDYDSTMVRIGTAIFGPRQY